MGIYNNDFGIVFSDLLDKSGVSCYKIHQYTHLNEGYLSHLRNGSKTNPSPETIMKIALAIVHFNNTIKISHINGLFKAVGRSLNIKDLY